jgi:type IV pilus assembly protein PilM
MAKIQAVWAIDIGQAALKALKLMPDEDPEKLHVEAFDYVEYPKILSQPDADAEELVREALMEFLGRNEVKGTRVALGVSGQAGLVKFIKLPPVEKKRIPDIVKFEARQQIPFALEEVIWDYQAIVGDDEEGEDEVSMTEVGLFAMKRDQINRAILPLKNAGIEVDVVQMGPIALYNYVAFDNPPPKGTPDEPNSYVVLDIGADNTDLIITDGTRIWQRNVPIGGNHFTRALTKELKLTFAKAEHLKRNATKAPDPRQVFTAMRGIFNDFSSEVSRSIGFYSSVNRGAKIVKVLGLGNGFKLPGLQKFLQQNLNHEVERVDKFERLTGEELTRPQFTENLASFAFAYGLGLQGLGLSAMRTNLLPPEIEQVRMIRRKKPWALVASTLLMVGFSCMYFSAWNALAKTKPFDGPVATAKSVTTQGTGYETEYASAKSEFEKIKTEGTDLVGDPTETGGWPVLLKTVMATVPNPGAELKQIDPEFDPNSPANVGLLGMLRVHIDQIVPVWREDVAAGWFDNIPTAFKATMNQYDQQNPPSGPGWVVQVLGHHYNPHPLHRKKELSEREVKFAYGPLEYIQEVILPRFWQPELKVVHGINHAALTWYYPDNAWTTEKGTSGVPFPDMLAKEEPAAEGGEGGSADVAQQMKMGGGLGTGLAMRGGGAEPGGVGGPLGGRMGGPMGGMFGGAGAGQSGKAEDMKTLTRTDFIIQFAWQPPTPEEAPKTPEELEEQVKALREKMIEASKQFKGAVTIDEGALQKESIKASEKLAKELIEEVQKAQGNAQAPQGAEAGGGTNPPAAEGQAPPAGGEAPKP